jgi:hypothetical protein
VSKLTETRDRNERKKIKLETAECRVIGGHHKAQNVYTGYICTTGRSMIPVKKTYLWLKALTLMMSGIGSACWKPHEAIEEAKYGVC